MTVQNALLLIFFFMSPADFDQNSVDIAQQRRTHRKVALFKIIPLCGMYMCVQYKSLFSPKLLLPPILVGLFQKSYLGCCCTFLALTL